MAKLDHLAIGPFLRGLFGSNVYTNICIKAKYLKGCKIEFIFSAVNCVFYVH
tara:strand:- start:8495 stop:8650 length:156 start_codon:yes stop_codon:yes gene_type:complete